MNRGTYKVIKGDATKPKSEKYVIIPHVCNTLGKWGAGFTRALDDRFGFGPRDRYRRQIKAFQDVEMESLGHISIVEVVPDQIEVVNMIAQAGVKGNTPSEHLPPIRYRALVQAMCEVDNCVKSLKDRGTDCEIHCPKFGSDLAGGDWKWIEILIQEIWVEAGIDVTVYEYDV